MTVTKSARTDFKMTLYAGWNLISVPSDPVDNTLANVFSNAGIKQVVTYSATTPKQPWRIASQDRVQTQKSDFNTILSVNIEAVATPQDIDDYVKGTSVTKGYKFLAASAEFDGLDLTDGGSEARIGDGLWVYVAAQSDGSTPDIVP